MVSKHTNDHAYTLFIEHILHILRSTVLVWQKPIIILKTETFNLHLILDRVSSAADEVKAWKSNMALTTFLQQHMHTATAGRQQGNQITMTTQSV